MILSVSRRTDIPAFYSDWFFNRIKEGYVCVRSPINAHQISRIELSPEAIDGIVFWTKNPLPMLSKLKEIADFPYYFQFTLNAYGRDIEPRVPSKSNVLISAFQQLSKRIGKERVLWRYDPIFFSEQYTMDYHCKYFRVLAERLEAYTQLCTISFLDEYKNTARNMRAIKPQKAARAQQEELAWRFAETAKEHGIRLVTCAEELELSQYGVSHGSCIDRARLETISGYRLDIKKDPNQRKECGCVASVDIGAYNTCGHGCRYCYANINPSSAAENARDYDPDSPLLCKRPGPGDVILQRKVLSSKDPQLSLFD
ncbi:MAG: DUF1848 domain-containing protein [Firmicutes bacterium]|nr:DUF1848 domain-containing protein [Bacillota bacterium]